VTMSREVVPVPDGSPDDYPLPNDFTGELRWVEIDVGAAAEDADHVLGSDELLRVAMARQ